MKKTAFLAAIVAGCATQAAALSHGWEKGAYGATQTYAAPATHEYVYAEPRGQPIYISCYRGPYRKVWWDKPNAKFINSLVAVGYDHAEARSIAYTICRDPALVQNPEGLRQAMKSIYYGAPGYVPTKPHDHGHGHY